MVTADGQFRTASLSENPDLFWALRGGGGNFGAVTSLEYRLHPVTESLSGIVLYPLDRAREVLRFYRDFCATLPDEAEAFAGLLTHDGVPVVALLLGYNGPIEVGEKVLAPARQFGSPIADLVGPMPYSVRQTLIDEPNAKHGLHRYWRSAFTEQISDELIDRLVSGSRELHVTAQPARAVLRAWRRDARAGDRDRVLGAAAAVGFRHHRAVDGRGGIQRPYRLGEGAVGSARAGICWAPSTSITSRRTTGRKSCARRIGENYARLRELKAVYDPMNLFRVNANVTPSIKPRK